MKVKSIVMAAALVASVSCAKQETSTECCSEKAICNQTKCNEMKYSKKYTNADFYTDGVFNQDVAMKAMKEMLAFYNIPITEFMEENMWVVDFGIGDFENVGMGGIFWINDKEHSYFAHAIYLLPGQMIPEHKHVATDMPAKHEAWMVDKGWCYNFSEVGEATPNAPAFYASHGEPVSKSFVVQKAGEIVPLKKTGTWHFLRAGDEGAVVTEWASYHDGAGLRFSCDKAKM